MEAARDGDTIHILPDVEFFRIWETVTVNKLVTIEPDSGKVVLTATRPIPVFQVTAQGSPSLHVIIRNLQIGGCTPPRTPPTPIAGVVECTARTSAKAAFHLNNDSYTEIANNIIGAEDLPIDNGIILSNSDHANIHDNTIQGNSRFVFTPLLQVGQNQTGFGIVSTECLGAPANDVSDAVTIKTNLFTNQLIAGIWLCSDGGGEHLIDGNTFRNNWRGIALKDVVNSTISNNTLTDEKSDGIIVYGASLRNTIQGNHVESHVAPAAAGIRIGWVADPIVPLSNNLSGNVLIRDTVGLHIFGARTTVVTNNQFKISGARTAILISPSTAPGDPGTQPYDTEITGNVIVFIGPCTAVVGCALRLVGTTVPVLATDNDWGLRRPADVEGVIWHQVDDPVLGLVTFVPFRNQAPGTAAPTPPPAGTAMPSGPTPGPSPGMMPTPTPTPGGESTSAALASSGGFTMRIPLDPGCTPVTWSGAAGLLVVDAVAGLTPAEAQRAAVVWRLDRDGWKAWGPGLPSTAPRGVFTLERGDRLQVCVGQRATWLIPTQVGGP